MSKPTKLTTQQEVEELKILLYQKNRELDIEAALEKVRARMLKMKRSEELEETCTIMYQQLDSLGVVPEGAAIFIAIVDRKTDTANQWIVTDKTLVRPPDGEIRTPLNEHPRLIETYEGWKRKDPILIRDLSGEELDGFKDYLLSLPSFQKSNSEFDQWPERLVWSEAPFSNGTLGMIYIKPLPEATLDILVRFSKAFDLTYTRFLDLQKAEAQAREAQIEVALERVRSSAMGMHNSNELNELIGMVFAELTALDLVLTRSILMTHQHESSGVKWWMSNSEAPSDPMSFYIQHHENKPYIAYVNAWKTRLKHWVYELGGKDKRDWDNFLFYKTELNLLPKEVIEGMMAPDRVFITASFDNYGCLTVASLEPLSEEHSRILLRFANVFEQTYTRFLDLQKAEAQAREAQIEAALERVRARAMGLHKSDELKEVIAILYNQLTQLGLELYDGNIVIQDESTNALTFWGSGLGGVEMPPKITIPFLDRVVLKKLYYENEDNDKYRAFELKGKELKNYHNIIMRETEFKNVPKEYQEEMLSVNRIVLSYVSIEHGWLEVASDEFLTEDHAEILQRFGSVVDLTYTRFADLQKAEAQAHEAEIQLALERVRARTMAMHKSEELAETAAVLFQQFNELGVNPERMNIGIVKEDERMVEYWSTEQGGKKIDQLFKSSIDEPTTISKLYTAWKSGKKSLVIDLTEEELTGWLKYLKEEMGLPFKDELIHERRVHSTSFFTNGMLLMTTPEPLSEEILSLLPRFAKVFEQTYTRFLDLQKAEAQAREAQIETALERVRSASMAMHNSNDVGVTVVTLFDEVLKLGLDNDIRCGIGILEGTKRMKTWSATLFPNGEVDLKIGMLDMTIHPLLVKIKNAWKRGEAHYKDQMIGKDVIRYYTALNDEPDYPFHIALDTLPQKQFHNSFSFSEGILFAFSPNQMSDEGAVVLDRFARVFGQTYRRYLDLQKAEEQTREAQIEAALERIRSKTLAMQSSADLHGVSTVLREQMGILGQQDLESSIVHLYNNSKTLESWYTFRSTETHSTKIVTDVAFIPVDSCDYIKETLEKYQSTETEYTIVSKGKKLLDWYNVMVKVAPDTIEYNNEGKMLVPEILHYHHSKFLGGALLMISNQPPSEESKELQRRAAKVFNLAYQRFLDLQQAEERTRESIKQASLDRVRGEIASMRSKEDLSRITPLIWTELKTLNVPFIRCGVFIMNEEQQNIESHLSTPDGKSLGVLNLPYNADAVGNNTVKFWKKGKIYKDHWNQKQFVSFMKKMVKLGRLDNTELFQGAALPPKSLDLHFVPFKQGMLYVGNTEPLTEEEIKLVSSLAEAFSIAYARYEDFTQLEQAKNQIENAMGELKSTQSQLIHAEKMASLGELTAGIAHEIQNPLNFVNNFSEVSKELIEEMKEEMDAGNLEDVKEISDDITQNLDKINHHGQRASSIVKGMLEHSRTGKQEKELTDINMLTDEYLRLSYHGLRAKDKSFNADFKTNLDEELPKVKVIYQDIGRVLLNMINNAFYAVSTKAKSIDDKSYKPEVTISTKRNDQSIEICVQDNGGGIPKEALDKIFQPFFTTKPTGEGTGLGLSLSYDIITQGHEGYLEVETEEGTGSRFIIRLPQIEH